MVFVAVFALGCSPSTQNEDSIPSEVPERVEGAQSEGAGEHGGSGGPTVELGTGSEGGGEHSASLEGAGAHSDERSEAGHEEGPGPGKESGQDLALTDVYDAVRNGARLRLAYDQASDSFRGIVQNTANETLCRVRVEVHLSNGTELGPTNPVDLPAGGVLMGELPAAGETFDRWSAHAETSPSVGGDEHSEGGEYGLGGEHGEGGEHGSNSD